MDDRKHIMIVDDEKGLVEFVRSLLVSKGYRVTSASNGQEGLKKLTSEPAPDLLILDMSMPKMGGIQLYTQICSRYGRTRYPVIVLTALEELTDFFRDALIDAFLPKPFQVNALLAKIEELLNPASRPLVWLLEDADPESQSLAELLRGERLRVEEVEDIEKASHGAAPDFILLEYAWKGHSGDETARRIRKHAPLRSVPLIVYSRSGLSDVEAGVLKAGADKYLGKPEDPKFFFAAMRQLHSASAAGNKPS